MPHEGKRPKLKEATVAKYNDFYWLAVELFGRTEADKLIRWICTNGRFARHKIDELTCKKLFTKIDEQEAALKTSDAHGHASRVEQTSQSTCHTKAQLKQLAKIWKQIADEAPSKSRAGELLQEALGDEYPWLSSTEKHQSGF